MKRERLIEIVIQARFGLEGEEKFDCEIAADLILDEMEKDKVLDKAGARDIEDLCNSVLGNCYLGKGPEEALATKIKASLRSAPASAVPGEAPTVDVMRMPLSDNRCDYFVRVRCGDRYLTPHVFRERWKAEYEVAQWQHLFGLRADKPGFREFTETTHPNDRATVPGELP